jgi:hypothetical protein
MTVDVATRGPALPANPALREKIEYANFLAGTDLLPYHFQRKPASVLWAMEYADALGLRNAAIAMASIHVIQNKPAPSAAMAAGLIRSKGHRLRVWVEPPNAEKGYRWGKAVAELRRIDDPEFPFRVEWTAEDAIQAEICKLSDKGELLQWNGRLKKWEIGNWQRYTKQMMKARALGEVCRDAATDVLLGLHYLAEEMEDVELDRNGEPVTPPDAQVPTVRASSLVVEDDARPLAEHARGGDVDTAAPDPTPTDTADPAEFDPVNTSGTEPITEDQAKILSARIRALGVKEPDRALRLIGLALESDPPRATTDLTQAQFRAVMEELSDEDPLTVAAWLDAGPVDNT